jgi:hypothetical protein
MINNEQRIAFSNTDGPQIALDILKRVCRSQGIASVIAKDEFSTVVNAITLDVESGLLQSFAREVEEIKRGKIYE